MPEMFWSITPLPHPLDCFTSDPLGPSASSSLLHHPSPTISEAETWHRHLILYLHWFVYWRWGIRFHGSALRSCLWQWKLKSIKGLSGWPSDWCKVRLCSPVLPSSHLGGPEMQAVSADRPARLNSQLSLVPGGQLSLLPSLNCLL